MNSKWFGVWLTGCVVLGAAAAPVQVIEERDSLLLANDKVRLTLDRNDFSLRQITDLAGGMDWVAEPGAGLFSVTGYVENQAAPVWYVSPPGIPLAPEAFPVREFSVFSENGRRGWRLNFRGAPLGDGSVATEVKVSLAEDSPLFQWEIAVDNTSSTPLQELRFPILGGLGSSRPGARDTEYMAVPLFSGSRYDRPREQITAMPGQSEYPGSGMSIQLLSYCDGQGGSFYYGVHDAEDYRKSFQATPSASKNAFSEMVIHYAPEMFAPGVWRLAYPIMAGPIAGDWYDAAKLYRSWAIQQPRWERSLAERDEIPNWFPNLPVWFQGNQWEQSAEALSEFADRIVAMREALGMDFGFHWYIWQKYLAHDYNYPDYFPARPGFADAVKKVQAAGVRVMPYLNIHLCETQLPMWNEMNLEAAAKRDSQGDFYTGYGIGGAFPQVADLSAPVDVFRGDQNGRNMVPMCLTEEVWQSIMVGCAARLLDEYGVDLIYYDETYVFPGLCFSRKHRHDWIGGTHHTGAVGAIHQATHRLRPERVVTTGENLGESYIDSCDALISAHSDMRPDSLPIFQSVHADRTTEIGCFVNQSELSQPDVFASKLAFTLTRGRVLGWLNSDQQALRLAEPEYAAQLDLLRRYCAARLAGLPWLYSGEMLRTPEVNGNAVVTRRWEIWPDFQNKVDYEFPVVLPAMFRAADGRLGLILCNLTGSPQQIVIPWNTHDWGGEPGRLVERTDFVDGGWTSPESMPLAEELEVTVPAWQPMIVALTP